MQSFSQSWPARLVVLNVKSTFSMRFLHTSTTEVYNIDALAGEILLTMKFRSQIYWSGQTVVANCKHRWTHQNYQVHCTKAIHHLSVMVLPTILKVI